MDNNDVLTFLTEGGMGEGIVLATIVSVEGHAYRKEGAMMLLGANCETAGSISPGCVEADLLARAPEAVRSGRAQLLHYDTSSEDDPLWGSSIGCGGVIQVLLEPVEGDLLRCLLDIRHRLDRGEETLLVRELTGRIGTDRIGYKAVPPEAAGGRDIPDTGWADDGRFVISFAPKPRLIVFGAGNDSRPLAALALRTGFRVVVADWRESLCTSERFPGAELWIGFPEEIIEPLGLNARDFVVVMSRQLERDREFIERLVPLKPAYVGIMGSEVRLNRLLGELEPLPLSYRYPVGLKIGAVGPEEIAVSVVAEMIAVRRSGLHKGNGAEGDGGQNSRSLFGRRSGKPDGVSEAFH